MKKFVTLLVTLLVIASLSFCAVAEDKPFAGQTLTISTFSFNAELLQKNIYDPFEEATGATLVVDTGRNPERVTKIIESPDDYDVVVIGDMFVDQLRKAGVLDTFDSSKLSNIEGIYENARAPMGEGYGPAYTFNRLGIVYDSAFCDVEIKSWADLWNPELADSIAVPEMTTTSGPLFYYATAAAFGLEPGKDDEAIFAKLAELKPNESRPGRAPTTPSPCSIRAKSASPCCWITATPPPRTPIRITSGSIRPKALSPAITCSTS